MSIVKVSNVTLTINGKTVIGMGDSEIFFERNTIEQDIPKCTCKPVYEFQLDEYFEELEMRLIHRDGCIFQTSGTIEITLIRGPLEAK